MLTAQFWPPGPNSVSRSVNNEFHFEISVSLGNYRIVKHHLHMLVYKFFFNSCKLDVAYFRIIINNDNEDYRFIVR